MPFETFFQVGLMSRSQGSNKGQNDNILSLRVSMLLQNVPAISMRLKLQEYSQDLCNFLLIKFCYFQIF